MGSEPTTWHETTEKMYWDMLECVPPHRMTGRMFLVGECDHANSLGEDVYAAFRKYDGGWQARYMTVAEFEAMTGA